ncbi:MAG: LamG domain-containing protein [Bacteroidales bacterium]|nr:LamG domain-containing protein [Bacteroidales bacterium]
MNTLFTILAAAVFSLAFDGGGAPGVSGDAAFFDGFDSRIVVPAADVPAPEKYFTVDVWVCPIAFPKSPCPVACRQRTDAPGGWSLWLDALGKVHFQVASAGEWVEVCSPNGLPLRQWSRLTAFFRAGSGLFLAIDGREVGKQPLELPSVEQAPYDLWIGRTQVRTPSFYENKSIPIYSSIDGAIDELRIYDDKNAYKSILKEKFVRPSAPGPDVPGFEERILPSGPSALDFGAWYIPLKFYPAFDNRWRGSLDDIVVGFGEDQPWKVVFWHGISYAPCFVTEKGNWMCNEFIERSKVTGWGCPESMSDKHADFSSVRIVENTPARTVVVWRNLPVGVNQKIPYQSEETLWGDCSEETYIFYPDGTCVRKMDLWTSNPTDWYEWCQSLQVLHPSQRPEDVLDASRIMSVAAMDGSSAEYGWNFEGKPRQSEPSLPGANIQVTYLKSDWNPYLILEDAPGCNETGEPAGLLNENGQQAGQPGDPAPLLNEKGVSVGISAAQSSALLNEADQPGGPASLLNEKGQPGPRIDRYAGHWSEFSDFPWRNHWPVAQDYVIGRYACTPDAPSHTYTATQYNPPHSVVKISPRTLPGFGRNDNSSTSVIPSAPSVISSAAENPSLRQMTPSGGKSPSYSTSVIPSSEGARESSPSTWLMTKLMLCGCTKGDAASLLPLAKSWLRAPQMTCGGTDVPYDITQRAYVLPAPAISGAPTVISSEVEKSLPIHLAASKEHPAAGLCLILPGLDKVPSEIRVDGVGFKDYKAGIRTAWDGPTLILWLPVTSDRPVDLSLTF